jgi:2-polyprenyl-6-methoxyphenol hydroxylase-like FAD-dependent oxidoreductase
MRGLLVTVLGGGVAGLATALILARDGHQVTLIERDQFTLGEPEGATAWSRKGIPHFLQPHAFIPRGRVELRAHLPDVLASLLEVGAEEIDVRRKLPGPGKPGDEDLQYLAVRRPLIEWALRRAVQRAAGIEVRDGARIEGLRVKRGRVTAVRVDASDVRADLVVDALGRRTLVPGWLTAAGVALPPEESSDCGVIYYSRYYRRLPGFEPSDGPWFFTPRGDLGYFGWAIFPGDNRTFAAVLAVPTGVSEWRALKATPVFEAAIALIPVLRDWVDHGGVEPITDVLPMAGLRNSIRCFEPTSGVVPVGDSLAHTDPVLAHGLAFSLIQAAEVGRVLRDHVDLVGAVKAYAAAVMPAVRERYSLATNLDEQRLRMWIGKPVDFTHRDGDYELFSMAAGFATAILDPDILRVFVRRVGLLDSTAVLDGDMDLQYRMEELFRQLLASRPRTAPTLEEMMAIAPR